MMVVVVRSILIVLLVSLSVAFSLKSFLGFSETFVFVTLLQFLIAFFWKSFAVKKEIEAVREISEDYSQVLEKCIVSVACPCGKVVSDVIIFANEEVLIKCDKCNNDFRVLCDIKTQLVTEPLNLEVVYDQLTEKKEL
jgi:Ca2+/Na+ antiporter